MNKDEEFEKWRMSINWEQVFNTQPFNLKSEEQVAMEIAQNLITDLELMSMDMLEHEVTESKNAQAKEMLTAIGIKCDD